MVFTKLLYRDGDLVPMMPQLIHSALNFEKFVQEENLKLDPTYNNDECGLYCKGLPTKNLGSKREKCASRHKSSDELLTVKCCGNAHGNHKLKLAVI
jgi:hypothetical protein